MTQAQIAIRAAKNWRAWGRVNAERYAVKRGVPLALVRLARQLETATSVGV